MTRPSPESQAAAVQHAYDVVAETYAAQIPDTRAETPLDLAMVEAFIVAVQESGDPTVLDAGCGTGRMSRHLADRGCRVEGMDLSPGMVEVARREHPDLVFTVGSLTELSYPDDHVAGVLLWYSAIHTPPEGLRRIFAETARVLRHGGHLLVGFQAGSGARQVTAWRQLGHDVDLLRHLFSVDQVAEQMQAVGLDECCRLVRRPQAGERDDRAVILARLD